ncbi:hypothetical protein EGT74_01275 [Chitinophaga lutea]|uniref:DUF5683 domain-containing protein n=1 Tax=Chitinophaga lutea TaxID=2488634 RepID=A0A3N4Q822_9BACT|nr:DUF5683 domain-containing protein [Chitinophaga lutea]RPE12217.1 hypothetical protein EGT74_01275 [Chitinophaga lutea]
MKNKTGYILVYTLLCLLLLPAIGSHAQDTTGNRIIRDSLARRNAMPVRRDTVIVDGSVIDSLPVNYKALHSPRKAAFYSAVLPGLGQVYNREYWKVPLVYAALGISTGFFIDNMSKFREYRDAYRTRIANRNNPNFVDPYLKYDDSDLKYLRDGYRQYVDYSVLVFVAAYALNIVDATVFAHLRQFDISDDLSIRIAPTMIDNRTFGIGLKVSMGPRKAKQGLAFR